MTTTSTAVSNIASKHGITEQKAMDLLAAINAKVDIRETDGIQPELRSDILSLDDLMVGDIVNGTVRNIADFGAFVDIGVHMDGLVHKSEMADKFVSNPMDILSVGQAVKVKIKEVDTNRNRISLIMRGVNQL